MTSARILYLCHGHPALHPGGTEIFAHDLFRAMRASGQVEPFFLGCATRLHRPQRPGAVLQAIGPGGDEALLSIGRFDRLMLAQTELTAFAHAMSELLTSFKPDIVHLHHLSLVGLEALVLIRRYAPQARIVMTLHDYHLICANDGLMLTRPEGGLCRQPSPDACHRCLPETAATRHALRRLRLNNLLSLVDQFIAPSAFLRERYVDWGLGAERIQVIANAVPAEDAPIPSGGFRQRRTFGVFGNIAPHKGTLVALEAARRLAAAGVDFGLRIHGSLGFQPPEFRQAFAEALAAASPFATHHGPYQREELPALLAAVDWVVVPSIWWENQPLVILESFRHGRPVICSDLGGMAEAVQAGRDGLHFRAGDAANLAEMMARAACDPDLWQDLHDRRPAVPTLEDAAQEHLALYRELMQRKDAA